MVMLCRRRPLFPDNVSFEKDHLMITSKAIDAGLAYLLDLDGEIFPMENGYWTKFAVRTVPPTAAVPHGIKYSLTLHNRQNIRVLGYDNAHPLPVNSTCLHGRKITWDHKHEQDTIRAYTFQAAAQLLADFW